MRGSNDSGFTLIELTLSVAISAIVFTGIGTLTVIGIKSPDQSQQRIEDATTRTLSATLFSEDAAESTRIYGSAEGSCTEAGWNRLVTFDVFPTSGSIYQVAWLSRHVTDRGRTYLELGRKECRGNSFSALGRGVQAAAIAPDVSCRASDANTGSTWTTCKSSQPSATATNQGLINRAVRITFTTLNSSGASITTRLVGSRRTS